MNDTAIKAGFVLISGIAAYFLALKEAQGSNLTQEKINAILKDTTASLDSVVKTGSVTAPAKKGILSRAEIKALAEETARDFPKVDPLMLRSMAEIESGRNTGAYRFEGHLGEPSIGILQTLVSTAQWLARDMGAKKYGVPSEADLYDARKSMYFGAAYINWLRRYGTTEEHLVRNYNGGPKGYERSATLNHWRKYQKARAEVIAYDNV